MREIVFDTETTGISPQEGHRIVEIGCVELLNHLPTGNTYHVYLNPERDVPQEVVRIHGLTGEFLKDKPTFAAIAKEFVEFLGDAKLIAHNASFDMNFINHHFKQLGMPEIVSTRVIDTLVMARKKFGNSGNSLDGLCKRFNIDNTNRTYHGALLDSELLAQVYLELIGGRQMGMGLIAEKVKKTPQDKRLAQLNPAPETPHRGLTLTLTAQEHEAHLTYISKMKEAMWLSS